MRKSKRLTDVEKGADYREECADLVNNLLEGEAELKRFHLVLKTPSGRKVNSLLNRLTPSNSEDSEGLGLDYTLTAKDGITTRFIAIRRFVDTDLFYKAPQGVSDAEFAKVILPQFHFLLFTPKLKKYALVSGGDLDWKSFHYPGNERRFSAFIKSGPGKGSKVRPRKDLHWIGVDGTLGKITVGFGGPGFDIPHPPLKEALLGILKRGSV